MKPKLSMWWTAMATRSLPAMCGQKSALGRISWSFPSLASSRARSLYYVARPPIVAVRYGMQNGLQYIPPIRKRKTSNISPPGQKQGRTILHRPHRIVPFPKHELQTDGQTTKQTHGYLNNGITSTGNTNAQLPTSEKTSETSKPKDGWFKSADQLDPHGMGMFVRLFEHKKPRKLGPLWHLYHLWIACIPSILIFIICGYVERTKPTAGERIATKHELEQVKKKNVTNNKVNKEIQSPAADFTAEDWEAFQKWREFERQRKQAEAAAQKAQETNVNLATNLVTGTATPPAAAATPPA